MSLQVCVSVVESPEYYSLCSHAPQLCSFQNPIPTTVFMPFTVTCFFAGVLGRYDAINNHLTQIFTCATLNVKNMLLEFFICVKPIIS